MSNLPSSASEAQMIDLFQNFKMPVMGAGGGFAPIGTINFFDASIAPQGWLACDGTIYNISDYHDLATYYASVHGASNFYGGNGTTTFAVPDLRGEFLRGTGTNSHANQGDGANVGVHQDGTITPYMENNGSGLLATFISEQDQNYDSKTTGIKRQYFGGSSSDMNGQAYTSRPTNTSFLICVKATVAGDPNGHVYSTEEQVVGTTEDGEYIYERVIKGTTPSTKDIPVTIESVSNMALLSVNGTIDKRYPIGISYPASNEYNSTIYINGARTSLLICVGESLVGLPYRAVIQYTKSS